jgi:hypothetical protein
MQDGALLPKAVVDLATGNGAGRAASPKRIRFTQTGRMRSGPNGRWMGFRAEQTIALDRCSFSWNARMGPFGVVQVEDSLDGGRGCLRVKALGVVPLMRAPAGKELDRGELMRYLAELAWAPDAILLNRTLRWETPSERCFVVSAGPADNTASVTLECDVAGHVVAVAASDRPMFANGQYRATPWFGRFFQYEHHAGYRLPFRAEVGWQIDGEHIVCWEARLLEWTAERNSD